MYCTYFVSNYSCTQCDVLCAETQQPLYNIAAFQMQIFNILYKPETLAIS